jgi:hypothetical protein
MQQTHAVEGEAPSAYSPLLSGQIGRRCIADLQPMKPVLPFVLCAVLAACGGSDGADRQQPQQGGPAAYTVQLIGGQAQTVPSEP